MKSSGATPVLKPVEVDPVIGLGDGGGGYPPWAYFTGMFLVPVVPWATTKIYFASSQRSLPGVVAYFGFRVGRPYGRLPAIAMATSVLAMGGNSFARGTAQYGLIVNALIVAMTVCQRHNRPVVAGSSMEFLWSNRASPLPMFFC